MQLPQVTERRRLLRARSCPNPNCQRADGTCLAGLNILCSHYSDYRIAADIAGGEAGSSQQDRPGSRTEGGLCL